MTFYPWDIFAGIIGFSAFWFKRYYRHAEQNAKLTARLLREDKLKDEFLANTSHELRTPLHGIINIAHTIAASERHSMNEKRIVLQPADLRVQSVASGVVDMRGFMTEGKPIRFSMDIPESFPHVRADEKRFVQILFNLLHNAVKYTEEGTIFISAEIDIGTAVSGREAIGMLDAEQWDLIIADVMMPQMSGYELARIVRERFSIAELPILLLTARNQPEDVYSGFLSGANDYVTKPVDALELKYCVRALATLKQSVSERLRIEAAYLQAQIQTSLFVQHVEFDHGVKHYRHGQNAKAGRSFQLFSANFWNSEQLVPLEHELELVRSYLYIEKERFEDRLHIVWEVEPDIRLQLPPLTIQPLVENAVKHGILSQRKGGTVRIRITDDSNCWAFMISDDGAGMDEEKVRTLLDSTQRRGRGIGLLNTDRRLKQLYGKGLSIASKPGEGTSISFIIIKTQAAVRLCFLLCEPGLSFRVESQAWIVIK